MKNNNAILKPDSHAEGEWNRRAHEDEAAVMFEALNI